LANSRRQTSRQLASSEAFEASVITQETPLVEQERRAGVRGLLTRLVTVAEAKPGWRALLLGGAAAVVGVLAVCVMMIAGPMASSDGRRGSANAGTTGPAATPPATAPTTTPSTTPAVSSPATTAEMTTSTTARGTPSPTKAPTIASPNAPSSQATAPPTAPTTTSPPPTSTTAPPTTRVTIPTPPRS
jgi:hypothetical protein